MNYVADIENGKAQLLDVRSKLEWKMGHAKGATRISVNDVMNGKIDDLDPKKPVYIYCASGGRAGMAESYLKSKGFQAINIGGINNWVQAGGATER